MTLFAVWALDGEGRGADRERVRAAHRARLRAPAPHAVEVKAAGPLLDEETNAMVGSLLVVEAGCLADVRVFVEDDPYMHAGVYARVEIRPFACGLGPWSSPP
jgi:uncharacterized protein YciI